jgi:SAM-dependent methyltransferase
MEAELCMSTGRGANSEQIEFWNGPAGERWARHQAQLDRALGPFGQEAIERLAPRSGERILDVGCGAGDTLLEIARRLDGTGEAVGADISRPMLEVARARALGLPNTRWIEADVAALDFDAAAAGKFDAAFSRFGVMFFADPVAAFQNLRRALVAGGRLSFVCWQAIEDNPWWALPLTAACAALTEPPPPVDPHAPGPFAFADPRHVKRILSSAGYARIEVSSFVSPVTLSTDGLDGALDFVLHIGPVARLLADQPEPVRDAIRHRLRSALAPVATTPTVALDGAVWLVTARA